MKAIGIILICILLYVSGRASGSADSPDKPDGIRDWRDARYLR